MPDKRSSLNSVNGGVQGRGRQRQVLWVQRGFLESGEGLCHFWFRDMVDAMGHSREKWKMGAPYRPQPFLPHWERREGSSILSPSSHSVFFFFHVPFFSSLPFLSPLCCLFPPLLGRTEKNWHLSVSCHVSSSRQLKGKKEGGAQGAK